MIDVEIDNSRDEAGQETAWCPYCTKKVTTADRAKSARLIAEHIASRHRNREGSP